MICKDCASKVGPNCFICNSEIIKMIKTIPDTTIDAREISKGNHNQLIEMEKEISMSVIKEDSDYFSKDIISLNSQSQEKPE